jgi:hypothetical protein
VETLDLRKEMKSFYAPSTKGPEIVDVPDFQFAVIDGRIEPGSEPGLSPAFAQALETLYGISYTLKFNSKQGVGGATTAIDYPVMPLEALWWIEDGEFSLERKDNWLWSAMIMQPAHITAEMFAQGVAQLRKKRGDSPALGLLRLERFHEGLAVQMMHIGPYSEEPATIARMDALIAAKGYSKAGKHHEIYLGDPRRAAPEKQKTILRHPIVVRQP